jgi:SAM-dependent methyltransferase
LTDPLDLPAGALARVDRRIHGDDPMFNDHLRFLQRHGGVPSDALAHHQAHYFRVGLSAFRGIRLAQLAAGAAEPAAVLDYGCGYGRVMRVLRAAYPGADIVGADVDVGGVAYCARAFQARPLVVPRDARTVRLDECFDLVWVGSVLTHLPERSWEDHLRVVANVLHPGGILVFTTHGRHVADRLAEDDFYGLRPDARDQALRDFRAGGFGYADYPGSAGYGISLADPSWVANRIMSAGKLRLISYVERGWDDHQDIVGCVAPPPSETA